MRPKSQLELERVEEHFGARCRDVGRVPWDPHVETGAETSLDQLRRPTRKAAGEAVFQPLRASVASITADLHHGLAPADVPAAGRVLTEIARRAESR